MEAYQHTINQAHIVGEGLGLHSGEPASLVFKPADIDAGLVFVRSDLPGKPRIELSKASVKDTRYCTVVSQNGVSLGTIEHVMSAVVGAGIDNIIIEVSGPEVPILDGSADIFLFALKIAGLHKQAALRRYIKIKQELRVGGDCAYAMLSPDVESLYNFSIDFNQLDGNNYIKHKKFRLTPHHYAEYIARARTFGFHSDLDYLQANNLIKGASLDNAVLIKDGEVINEGGLRFPDELVAHKILDAIGDMALIGHRFIGCYYGFCAGHGLNNQLCHALKDHPDTWEYVTLHTED